MTCVILLIYVIASTQNIFLFSMKVSLGLKTSSINKDQYLSSRCLKNANYFGSVLRTLFSLQNVLWRRCSLVKFIYSEKAANFCEIFPLLLTVCTVVKSKGKISQNFVAFSEYMNFKVIVRMDGHMVYAKWLMPTYTRYLAIYITYTMFFVKLIYWYKNILV